MKWMVLRLWENAFKFPNQLMMDLTIEVMEAAVEVVVDQEAEVHSEAAEEVVKDHTERRTQLPLRTFLVVAIGLSSRIL